MSDKSLGQIAWEGFYENTVDCLDWSVLASGSKQRWENSAAAVKKEVLQQGNSQLKELEKRVAAIEKALSIQVQQCYIEHGAAENTKTYIELLAENARLKSGNFTDEEFQEICHNLPDRHDANRFCDGCEEYQRRLFGWSPITKLKDKVASFEHDKWIAAGPCKDP